MKHILLFLMAFLCFTCSSGYDVPDVTNGLDPNGANVCSFPEQVTKQVSVSFLQSTLVKMQVLTCCNWFCWSNCTKSVWKTKKYTTYRMETRYFDRKNYYCCSDWSRENKQITSCQTPICNVNCRNGGKCVGPDTCSCLPGFKGKFCQIDNDECKDVSRNNCDQVCVNMVGGFKCSCKRGFTLNADGKTCQDNNECGRPSPPCSCSKSDGVCASTCVNTPGSYQCKCGKGYRLNSAEQCEDINECIENSKLCDQKCVNTPGSYYCACSKGYRHNGTKCVDIDECANNKGNCSDNCHNLDGGYVCSCPDKFYLARDRRTCKVIEPTMTNKVFCESDQLGFLSCEKSNEKIVIIDAMYGRLSKDHCQIGNYTQNLRCQADDPAAVLRKSCNHQPSCVFFMLKDKFGDPCPRIEKYLQVTYDCLP